MSKKKFIVLDTEGCSLINHKDDGAHPETSLFYDFGFIVADGDGKVYEEHSYVNPQVFFRPRENWQSKESVYFLESAYYADKLPQYREGFFSEWEPLPTLSIHEAFKAAVKRHKVTDIWAFNVRYDMQISNNTLQHFTNGARPWFKPYGTKYFDIWDYAGSTICNTKKYVKWCHRHGYVSDKGNPKTGAEFIARYVYGETDFIERHTALSDCYCELDILLAVKKGHHAKPKTMGQGWRAASKLYKKMQANGELPQ